MGFLAGLKSVTDGLGVINQGTRLAMELLDPQAKSQFEMLLYPQSFSLEPSAIAHASLDTIITKLYVQTMSLSFMGFEYERMNEEQYLKGITYPDEVSFTFIETELGIVRNYIDKWIESIITPDASSLAGGGYRFQKNLKASKKNGLIILQMANQIPSNGWIEITGLRFKSMGDLTIGHGEGDYMTIDCTMVVDNIKWLTLI